jgi:hypothetical protein
MGKSKKRTVSKDKNIYLIKSPPVFSMYSEPVSHVSAKPHNSFIKEMFVFMGVIVIGTLIGTLIGSLLVWLLLF